MSTCHKCGLSVHFAERKTVLGKAWHRECFVCWECGKVLNLGHHVEHCGRPYCHVPCYRALFGPTMFGHGSEVDAHTSFGDQVELRGLPISRKDFLVRLKEYNEHHSGKRGYIEYREINGCMVLQGQLRVHWGVTSQIKLKDKDDTPVVYTKTPQTPRSWRRSYNMAIHNGLGDDLMQKLEIKDTAAPEVKQPTLQRRCSLEDITELQNGSHLSPQESPKRKTNIQRYRTIAYRGEAAKYQRASINGHVYNLDTSLFTPVHGSVTSVQVSSLDPTPDVIRSLMAKFKVENDPDTYCLCVVKKSGETSILQEEEIPLIKQVLIGPIEEEASIFIKEKESVQSISPEVAQYVGLPLTVLNQFLQKYDEEEDQDLRRVRKKYKKCRNLIVHRMSFLNEEEDTRM